MTSPGLIKLLNVVAALRTPKTGCPWDLEQTSQSLAPYTLEEAYEVVDAIETGSKDDLKKELGDLLLQVVYHAQIAEEEHSFNFNDVALAATEKMIARHPHVFGSENVGSASEQTQRWEDHKAAERSQCSETSVLGGIAKSLPAITHAATLQKRVARVGFDWPNIRGVLGKIREEIDEFEQELDSGNARACREEFGDLLFTVVNLSHHLDLNPETVLRHTNRKFERRFRAVEALAEKMELSVANLSPETLEALWNQVKTEEKTIEPQSG